MRMRAILFSTLLTFAPAPLLAEEVEPNGAVPGLLSPVMELQFASRMEGKTLFQLGEDIVAQGDDSLKNKAVIPGGIALGMKVVAGEPSKYATWRVSGLEREIEPIRIHLHRLHEKLKNSSELSEKQKASLQTWMKKFDDAEAACIKDPTLTTLDTLSDILLVDIQSVFETATDPQVILLEAIMEASTADQRLWLLENYFGRIMEAFNKRIPIEDVPLIFDGVGIHPSVILLKQADKKAVTGFEKKYGPWIKKITERLRQVEKDGSLLAGRREELKKLVAELDKYNGISDNGKLESIGKGMNLLRRIGNFLYREEKMAPVALRVGVGIYASNQYQFFGRLIPAVQQDLKNGKEKLEYKIGGIGVRASFDEKGKLNVTFTGGTEPLIEQLDSTIRLSEQTLAASKMEEPGRKILIDAIQALKETKEAVSQTTSYAKWAELTNTINEIHRLYKF